jgi:ribosomal protein S18 acetylase RimI-like enzyme
MPTDYSRVLYGRMEANLVGSWARYAAGSPGARLEHVPGATVAAFPSAPERDVFNNAVLARDLDQSQAGDAIAALETVYADAAIGRYAVWAHESETASIAALEARGYHVDSFTYAMAMSLDSILVPRPELTLAPADWRVYLTVLDVPPGLLAGVDPSDFYVMVVTADGENVAAAMAYDHDGDCGIYNVVTVPHARRRGVGTALTALQLHEARARGCTTASLQATEMAHHIYAAVGFVDLGRFIEYVTTA